MTDTTKTIESCGISVESIRRETPWVYMNDYMTQFTKAIATLVWSAGNDRQAPQEAGEAIIAEHSRFDDAVVFTDGSVKPGVKSG